MVSFPTLVFTGFALKYPDSWWSKPLLLWESGFGVRGGLHRTAAIVLIAATILPRVHLVLKSATARAFLGDDARIERRDRLVQVFRYNLGLTESEPTFKKFNYAEKMEYWAFMWGTLRDGPLRVPAVVQQFHAAPLSEMGDGRGHRSALV